MNSWLEFSFLNYHLKDLKTVDKKNYYKSYRITIDNIPIERSIIEYHLICYDENIIKIYEYNNMIKYITEKSKNILSKRFPSDIVDKLLKYSLTITSNVISVYIINNYKKREWYGYDFNINDNGYVTNILYGDYIKPYGHGIIELDNDYKIKYNKNTMLINYMIMGRKYSIGDIYKVKFKEL